MVEMIDGWNSIDSGRIDRSAKNMKRVLQLSVIIGMMASVLIGGESNYVYRLNELSYSVDIAPPHEKLPSLNNAQGKLLCSATTSDILVYTTGAQSVTCRVSQVGILECSNGLEMNIGTQNIQQIFQLLAEVHIMLHSPQQPPEQLQDKQGTPVRIIRTEEENAPFSPILRLDKQGNWEEQRPKSEMLTPSTEENK